MSVVLIIAGLGAILHVEEFLIGAVICYSVAGILFFPWMMAFRNCLRISCPHCSKHLAGRPWSF